MSPVKLGLKCHPAQVPTSWKPFCKCSISSFPEHSPRNINLSPVWWHKSFQVIWIQVIWIQVIPETLPHDRVLPPSCLPVNWMQHADLCIQEQSTWPEPSSGALPCSGVHMLGAHSALTQMLGHLHLSLVREGTGTNAWERGLQKGSTVKYLISWVEMGWENPKRVFYRIKEKMCSICVKDTQTQCPEVDSCPPYANKCVYFSYIVKFAWSSL